MSFIIINDSFVCCHVLCYVSILPGKDIGQHIWIRVAYTEGSIIYIENNLHNAVEFQVADLMVMDSDPIFIAEPFYTNKMNIFAKKQNSKG